MLCDFSGPSCIQWDHFKFDDSDKVRGSEDCLYLNVYTPTLSSVNKLPVFVYIHGGAFMFGNGDYYGPKVLTTKQLVFVNLNYRLGPLGFLSTEDEAVPGNMGMKDQVLALKWIQKNIANFGGDPEQVTITGFSAGGASVHLHYMSQLSIGLFNRGISHSGCALNPWVFQENAKEKAFKVGSYLGCTSKSSFLLKKCLKEKPAEDIVRTVPHFQPYLYNPFSPFAPVVEPNLPRAFLIQKPIEILRDHKFQELPWLASATQAEGLYPAGEFMRHEEYLPLMERDWNHVLPHILDYNYTVASDRLNEVSQLIKEHYLGDKPLTKETFKQFVDIISDRLYKHGLAKAIKIQGQFASTFFYHFNFKTVYGDGEDMSQKNENLGVAHGEDVYLLYSTEDIRGSIRPYTENERKMIELLLDMYLTFSKTGQPKLGTVSIPKVTKEDSIDYLQINGPDKLLKETATDFGEEKFWDLLNFNENKVTVDVKDEL